MSGFIFAVSCNQDALGPQVFNYNHLLRWDRLMIRWNRSKMKRVTSRAVTLLAGFVLCYITLAAHDDVIPSRDVWCKSWCQQRLREIARAGSSEHCVFCSFNLLICDAFCSCEQKQQQRRCGNLSVRIFCSERLISLLIKMSTFKKTKIWTQIGCGVLRDILFMCRNLLNQWILWFYSVKCY